MSSHVRQWEEQKYQEKLDTLFGQAFNYIIEEWEEEEEDESEYDSEEEEEEEDRPLRESAPEPEPSEPPESSEPPEDSSYFWASYDLDDDNTTWDTESIIELDIMEMLELMQKNFNKLRDKKIDHESLFSMITNPNLKIVTLNSNIIIPKAYEPITKNTPRLHPKGSSQKCRRRQGQIPGFASSLIQLLSDQLFLIL